MQGKKILKSCFLVLGVFIFCGSGEIIAQNDSTDTQVWNQNSFEFPLDRSNEKLSGVISNDFRITEDVSDLDDIRFGFAVKYKATKNITIAPNYVFRVSRVSGAPDRYEHQLRFDVTPSKKFKNFTLDNRTRLEHRLKTDGRDDDTFIRNRTRIRIPVRKDGKTLLTPFVSYDTWFDVQNPDVFRNDAAAGISKKINDNTSFKVFYNYRRNFRSVTKHEHAIGVGFSFSVD